MGENGNHMSISGMGDRTPQIPHRPKSVTLSSMAQFRWPRSEFSTKKTLSSEKLGEIWAARAR
jgi:hypothetical protein